MENNFGPGWVVILRKPYPFGKAWHIICRAMSVVVFFVGTVEGKDRPKERRNPEFKEDYGATGGLMIWMTKTLFGTGKNLMMESIFCVLKGKVGMLAHGVYGKTVIKKKRE